MATKDYDDYIDWTYENGYDPADFDSYDEYVDKVLSKVPPINYDRWDRDSKKLLQSELTDFFIGSKTDYVSSDKGEGKTGRIIEQTTEQYRLSKAKTIGKSIRWQTKRKQGSVSKTVKLQVKSIEKKTREGTKLNKSEIKLRRSSQMSRSWELQQKFGYSRSEAMKRAAKEYKI